MNWKGGHSSALREQKHGYQAGCNCLGLRALQADAYRSACSRMPLAPAPPKLRNTSPDVLPPEWKQGQFQSGANDTVTTMNDRMMKR